jgi:hypothetical protein
LLGEPQIPACAGDNVCTPGCIYQHDRNDGREVRAMLILLIILLVLMFGSFPAWPYSRGWGYYPSGGLGLILLIVLILVLTNHRF